MTEALLFETDGRGVARLTLNRPERRNALDGDLVGALLARLAAIDGDPEIRVSSSSMVPAKPSAAAPTSTGCERVFWTPRRPTERMPGRSPI